MNRAANDDTLRTALAEIRRLRRRLAIITLLLAILLTLTLIAPAAVVLDACAR